MMLGTEKRPILSIKTKEVESDFYKNLKNTCKNEIREKIAELKFLEEQLENFEEVNYYKWRIKLGRRRRTLYFCGAMG